MHLKSFTGGGYSKNIANQRQQSAQCSENRFHRFGLGREDSFSHATTIMMLLPDAIPRRAQMMTFWRSYMGYSHIHPRNADLSLVAGRQHQPTCTSDEIKASKVPATG